MYLNFCILLVALSQTIGTLSEENIQESSDLLVRQKRVIDKSIILSPQKIKDHPWIVAVLYNKAKHCAGVIVTSIIVLTPAHCVGNYKAHWPVMPYTVLSASNYLESGTEHNVSKVILHPDYHRFTFNNDIALLILENPIQLGFKLNKRIKMMPGRIVPAGTPVTITGWGHTRLDENEVGAPEQIRTIVLSTISQEECARIYTNRFNITKEFICTYNKNKFTGPGDDGAPLVNGQYLVGIFIWRDYSKNLLNPDVFVNLIQGPHRTWINMFVSNYKVPEKPIEENKTNNDQHLLPGSSSHHTEE